MKKSIFIYVSLLLISCNSPLHSNGEESSLSSSSSSEIDTSSILVSDNEDISMSSQSITSSKEVVTSSIEQESTKLSSSESVSYNEDGSAKLPIPTKEVSSWGQQETKYDFSSQFPEEFSYIYGHKILDNPSFYSKGGWKITFPNSSARMGFQTPLFNSDLKIEIRLYISEINNSNNKVDKDNPFITIYGFDMNGELIRTSKIENVSNFYNYQNSSSPLNFYFNGEGISYLELRFTSAPYKNSQCYNFGINSIGFKTFPYPLN